MNVATAVVWMLVSCKTPPEPADADGDGWAADVDCDDANPAVHPDAEERCGGGDEDCDGDADDGAVDALAWYADADGDGWGVGAPVTACARPYETTERLGDCDDNDTSVHPGATETCDGGDQDCDGVVDDSPVDAQVSWPDVDRDGFGDPAGRTADCLVPEGFVDNDEDCDDTSDGVHPGALERCNGGDEDCDGEERLCPYSGTVSADDVAALTIRCAFETENGCHPPTLAEGADLDGDGQVDLAMGFFGADLAPDYYYGGAAWLWRSPVPSGVIWAADASSRIYGDEYYGQFGSAMVAVPGKAGQVAALAISAPYESPGEFRSGRTYVFNGIPDDSVVIAGDAASTVICGSGWEAKSGTYLVSGRFDADGVADLLVWNSRSADPTSWEFEATLHLVARPIPSGSISLDDVAPSVRLGDGTAVSPVAGDLDGDGLDDLVIGDIHWSKPDHWSGAALVFAGPLSIGGELTRDDAERILVGEFKGAEDGRPAAVADFDGDGRDDLVTSTGSWPDGGVMTPGRASLMLSPFPPGVSSIGDAAATFTGLPSGDGDIGNGETAAVDINGDGAMDLAIGVPQFHTAKASGTGAVVLWYGPLEGDHVASDADATIVGSNVTGMELGETLASAGDVDGDGYPDLLAGSSYSPDRTTWGSALLFLGGDSP